MILISTSQASEELSYSPTWPSRWLPQSYTRAISHDADWAFFHTYNASSQLVSSDKSTFVENPNARKVQRVGMANPYQINGMEIQGFLSAKNPTSFRSTGPAVQNRSSSQTQAKDAFDLLTHHEIAVVTHPFSLYLICKCSTLVLRLQIRCIPHGCIITITYLKVTLWWISNEKTIQRSAKEQSILIYKNTLSLPCIYSRVKIFHVLKDLLN